jgi:hypothetical protein
MVDVVPNEVSKSPPLSNVVQITKQSSKVEHLTYIPHQTILALKLE